MSARIIPLKSVRAQVALELAAGLIDESDIEERFGIANDDWEIIKASPYFKRMLEDANEKVGGANNTPKRIRMKAQVALEDSLPAIYSMIHDQDAPHSSRLEAARTLFKLSGVEAQEANLGAGFSITINMGDSSAIIEPNKVDGAPVLDTEIEEELFTPGRHPRLPVWGSIDVDKTNEEELGLTQPEAQAQ